MRQHLVVVGASRAGLFAVEGARRAGYEGPITLVGAEAHLPYDRPPLSKEFLDAGTVTPPAPTYRTEEVLRRDFDVEIRLGTTATRLDPGRRTVWLGDEPLTYSGLVIATGATPRTMPGTGHLEGVLTLRTVDDARELRAGLDAGARTVVVGAGLIGSEVASAARKRNHPVTVVEALPVPLVRAVGERIGMICAGLHARHGTTLLTGVTVTAIQGAGRVERVWLSDGSTLDADLVAIGTGVVPATDWLAGSGLEIDNGVVCDNTLATGAPGVYAAGDVASWHNPQCGQQMRLEQWASAAEQGRIAGRNATCPTNPDACATVPYMWSDQYGNRLQFTGVPTADEIRTVTDHLDDGQYLALYRTNDRLTGAFGINQTRTIPKLHAMIRRGAQFVDGVARCTS